MASNFLTFLFSSNLYYGSSGKSYLFSGHTIPKGWKVLVWFGIVHMDPDIYESPQDFNPSRWDNVSGVLRYVKHFFLLIIWYIL
jgi:hypothetical protein